MISYFDFNAPTLAQLEPLTIFTRNEATEKYLDERQISQERSHCQSIHLFCKKLESLVEEFNQNRFYRSRLVNFLESGTAHFVENLQRDFPADEYLKGLTRYLHTIGEQIGINLNYPVNTRLNHLINNLRLSLEEIDYDLSRLYPHRPFWTIGTANYGKILINQQNTIALIDNLTLLNQETLAPGNILFITVPVSNEQIDALFARHRPLVVVYRGETGMVLTDAPIHSLHRAAYMIRCAAAKILKKPLVSSEAENLMPVIVEEMETLELLFDEYEKNQYYRRDEKIKTRFIYEKIKRLQLKVMHLHFEHRGDVRKLGFDLEQLADNFNRFDEKAASISQLPQTIIQGINNITSNSNLYRVSNDVLFNENNLTAGLLTWLKASLPPVYFTVLQEEPIANGRSDISIHTGRDRISVIESKLVQMHAKASDIQKKIKDGVFQLYIKYSDAVVQSRNMPPEMFLVLFCFNPKYQVIRENIVTALEELTGEHSRLTIIRLDDPTNSWFRFRLQESGGQFPDKIVDINLVIASLRTQDNGDEKHGKYRR